MSLRKFLVPALVIALAAPALAPLPATAAPELAPVEAPVPSVTGPQAACSNSLTTSIYFDVYVDGSHACLIPTVGNVVNYVYVDVIPYVSTNPYYALGAEVVITPTLGGCHTVGIGYRGINMGVYLCATAGNSVNLYLQWDAISVTYYAQNQAFMCNGSGMLQYRSAGLATIYDIVFSVGTDFSSYWDTVYVDLQLSSPVGVGTLPTRTFYVDACGGFKQFRMDDSSGFSGATFKAGDFRGNIWGVPCSIDIRHQYPNGPGGGSVWDDGYDIYSGCGTMSGSITGHVNQLGGVDVDGSVYYVKHIQVGWDGSAPWVYLGLKLPYSFSSAHVHAKLFGHVDATTDASYNGGNIYYNNSPAINNNIGNCNYASAFFGSVREAHLCW